MGALRNTMMSLAAFGMAAAPATAQDAVANNNDVQITQVTATASITPEVQMLDARNRSENDARGLAAIASRDKVAIVVWGGNRTIQQEAYFAARDLAGAGIPVAFMVGPDGNGIDADAYMQIYAASTPRRSGTIANNGAERIRPLARQGGLDAYREAFPTRAAALNLE